MSALTKDRNTVRKQGEYAVYQVLGGAEVFAGSIVCLDANGYAQPGSDTAGLRFAGVARAYVDNTSGADGDEVVEVWRKGAFELGASGMTAGDAGEAVFVVDDQTVGLSGSVANHVACGAVSEVNSAASVYVDVDRV